MTRTASTPEQDAAAEAAAALATREAGALHAFGRPSAQGFGGSTTITCACGWTNTTNAPQHHNRAIVAHRNACKKEAARLARKAARAAQA